MVVASAAAAKARKEETVRVEPARQETRSVNRGQQTTGSPIKREPRILPGQAMALTPEEKVLSAQFFLPNSADVVYAFRRTIASGGRPKGKGALYTRTSVFFVRSSFKEADRGFPLSSRDWIIFSEYRPPKIEW